MIITLLGSTLTFFTSTEYIIIMWRRPIVTVQFSDNSFYFIVTNASVRELYATALMSFSTLHFHYRRMDESAF